ncbi:MAG: transcriptional regulator [Planctomycetaceae bacterium]|nr:transcriptional regulator [Planctomycetaceae bacterium]
MSSAANRLRVLFVDDEAAIREVMKIELPRMGHDLVVCEDGEAAIKALEEHTFDAAIVDLRMPGIDGWEVVDALNETSPETQVIIHTGHGNMEEAIQAIRRGAYDFLPKPCMLFDISTVLQRVADRRALTHRAIALESRLKAVEGTSNLIGDTPAMERVKQLTERIAPTDSTVLILGETGTGKELVARRIHELSKRSDMPFVAVNCGALPENIVESEFFGHRKGAFTGAESNRKGLFEVANGGTLFLDELGELDKTMQVKLLRFLESGEIRRIGENEAFNVDVRIVAATNRPLQDMVNEGSFREDLFFRVNTFEMHLPPLRQRKDDIPELALHLIARALKRPNVDKNILPQKTIDVLLDHEWSGNVRELANALEHAMILCDGQCIQVEDLPASITQNKPSSASGFSIQSFGGPKTLREIEMEVIFQVLEKHRGDKPKTATELGIALKTLYNKLNQYISQRNVA